MVKTKFMLLQPNKTKHLSLLIHEFTAITAIKWRVFKLRTASVRLIGYLWIELDIFPSLGLHKQHLLVAFV